jgi:hypothetical protein
MPAQPSLQEAAICAGGEPGFLRQRHSNAYQTQRTWALGHSRATPRPAHSVTRSSPSRPTGQPTHPPGSASRDRCVRLPIMFSRTKRMLLPTTSSTDSPRHQCIHNHPPSHQDSNTSAPHHPPVGASRRFCAKLHTSLSVKTDCQHKHHHATTPATPPSHPPTCECQPEPLCQAACLPVFHDRLTADAPSPHNSSNTHPLTHPLTHL